MGQFVVYMQSICVLYILCYVAMRLQLNLDTHIESDAPHFKEIRNRTVKTVQNISKQRFSPLCDILGFLYSVVFM